MNRRDRKILKSIEKLSERLAEDQLYQIVADELEEGFVDGVASLRANEIAEGNKEKAESIYPKQRMRRLLDLRSELSVIESIHNESKKKQKLEVNNEKEIDGKQLPPVEGSAPPAGPVIICLLIIFIGVFFLAAG